MGWDSRKIGLSLRSHRRAFSRAAVRRAAPSPSRSEDGTRPADTSQTAGGWSEVSIASAVGRFMLASLVAVLLLAAVGLTVQRRLATDDAINDAKTLTALAGHGIVGPNLTDAVLSGDPAAIAGLDRIVRERVLSGPVLRVKIWSGDGTILYSDEPRLIGATYPLGDEDREALVTGATDAELSDLSAPENRYEQGHGRLLEVYLPIRTRSGRTVLYESYSPLEGVSIDGRHLWIAFMPPLVGAVLLLWLTQAPLAWSMARRLRAGQRERVRLLRGTIEAADSERRRIAGDLHDGVVQDLAGAAMSLAAARGGLHTTPAAQSEAMLDEGVATIRESMREMRDLIIEISPPNLADRGLAAALGDLLDRLVDRGIETRVEIDGDLYLDSETERLLYRGAKEGLRNVLRHSGASSVGVAIVRDGRYVRLTIDDDGQGLSAQDRARARREGHVGLDLLAALVASAGGELEVASRQGDAAGTRMRLELPHR